MAGETELQLLISVQNEATAALDGLNEQLQAMTGDIESATSGASEAIDGLTASAQEALSGIPAAADQAASSLGQIAPAADAALSQLPEVADAAASGVTAALDGIGTSVEGSLATAQQGVDALSASADAAAEPLQALGAEVGDLTAAVQAMGVAAKEATSGLEAVGSASEVAAEQETTFAEAIGRAQEGLDLTKTAMTGFMAIATAGMLGEVADGAEKTAIQLDALQSQTGLTAQQTERLMVMAAGTGVSLDSLTRMVGRMDMRLGRAESGTTTLSRTLAELGVNAQAFTAADPQGQAQMLYSAMERANLPAKQMDSTLKSLGVNALQFNAAAQPQKLAMLASGLTQVVNSGQSLGRMLQGAGIDANQFIRLPLEQKMADVANALKTIKNPAQADALLMTVFGRQGEQMRPLLQNFQQLDSYARSLKMPNMDSSEITLAAEHTKQLMATMQLLGDSILVKVLPLVDSLGKAFYDLATNLAHPITAVQEFTADLGPATAAVTGLVMAYEGMKVINALATTVTQFAAGIRSLSILENAQAVATKVATAAQAAFNAVMDANPIALVILALAALGVAIYEIVAHWKQVKQFTEQVWTELTGWLKARWLELEETVQNTWSAIVGFVQTAWMLLITQSEKKLITVFEDGRPVRGLCLDGLRACGGCRHDG